MIIYYSTYHKGMAMLLINIYHRIHIQYKNATNLLSKPVAPADLLMIHIQLNANKSYCGSLGMDMTPKHIYIFNMAESIQTIETI